MYNSFCRPVRNKVVYFHYHYMPRHLTFGDWNELKGDFTTFWGVLLNVFHTPLNLYMLKHIYNKVGERLRWLHLTNSWELPFSALLLETKLPTNMPSPCSSRGFSGWLDSFWLFTAAVKDEVPKKKTQNKTWRSDRVTPSRLQWPLNSSGQRPNGKYSACPCCESTGATTQNWPLQRKKKNPRDAEPS